MKNKCVQCGKEEDAPLHIRYGADVNNPRKHEFVPKPKVEKISKLEDLEKRIAKLEENQRDLVSIINDEKKDRYRSYYMDSDGNIKSFVDD